MVCGGLGQCAQVLLQLLVFGLSNGAVIALNALGVTLVYSVVRTVNFAYGDLFALSTVLVTTVILNLGLSAGSPLLTTLGGLGLALVASMSFGALLNIGVERIAFRPFRSGSRLAPLIAGIGLSFMLFQAAILWRTAAEVGWGVPEHHSDVDNLANVPHFSIPKLFPDLNLVQAAGLDLRVTYTLKDLLLLILTLALTFLVGWFLTRTQTGRVLRACAQDAEMAELCGVDRGRAIVLVFGLGGALAGAAAFIFALYYERPFGQHGAESGLLAFTAAVLGGIGNPVGALISGLLLGILSSFSDYILPAQWTPVVVLGTLIALLALRPTGLAAEDQSVGLTNDSVMTGEGRAGVLDRVFARGAEKLPALASLFRRYGLVLLLGLALAYPLVDSLFGFYRQAVASNILLFVLLALGLNIVLGFAGVLDLGYAACFAVGGYTAALLLSMGGYRVSPDFLIVLLASAAAAGLFGGLNGLLTLRLRGDYLAVVALAFGQMVPRVLVNLDRWTGGSGGLSALPAPHFFAYTLRTQTERYYLVLGLVALIVLASRRLKDSRMGRAWSAISADETAAASCGINLARVRPLAFVIGAAIAGVAAALYAGVFGYIAPDQADFRITTIVLAMVVIGGAGSVQGAVIGALAIASYDQVLLPMLGTLWSGQVIDLAELNFLSFGLALYLTVWLRGRG